MLQYDLKNRRTFLKRCDYPGVGAKDLFKGSIITVYSRQLTIKDYADSFTASIFEKSSQMCAAPRFECLYGSCPSPPRCHRSVPSPRHAALLMRSGSSLTPWCSRLLPRACPLRAKCF